MMLQAPPISVTRLLHRLAPLRAIAKRTLAGHTISQRFHGGVICLDAVEHSWAWTGRLRYETFDRDLQARLLELAERADIFIDIGCNIGAMTLSMLLRAPHVRAVAVDPNARAIQLLCRSLARNGLESRATVIEAAAGSSDGIITFDESGSVTGHVSAAGRRVRSIDVRRLLNSQLARGRCLLKMDVEGYEAVLLQLFQGVERRERLTLVVEIHPAGFNGTGDPRNAIDALRRSGATVTTLEGAPTEGVQASAISQLVATWL